MKREIIIFILAALILAACGNKQEQKTMTI